MIFLIIITSLQPMINKLGSLRTGLIPNEHPYVNPNLVKSILVNALKRDNTYSLISFVI